MSDQHDTKGGKAKSFPPGRTLGEQEDRLPMLPGTGGNSQNEMQLGIARARLMPITCMMLILEGEHVGDENSLGESSLTLRVDSTGDQSLAVRLLADMDEAGLAPSVVVVEHSNARYDGETGCFVYGPPA